MSSLTEVGVGLLAAVVIAMVSSWILAVVVVAFVPPLVVAGLVQVWLLGRTGSGKPSPSSQVWLLPSMSSCNWRPAVMGSGLSMAAGEPGVCAAHTDCTVVWATRDLHEETHTCYGGAAQVDQCTVPRLSRVLCSLFLLTVKG